MNGERLESSGDNSWQEAMQDVPAFGDLEQRRGEKSFSEAGVEERPAPIEAARMKQIVQAARNIAGGVESDYYRYIRNTAKKESVPYDELLAEVREETKEARFGDTKDLVKFYHSTSIDGLSDILNSGGNLLSRTKRKELGEDISKLPWSSSDNVQFSYDTFDENGELARPGFSGGRGASGSEISFVFGGDLTDEKSFDAAFTEPTVEQVNLSEKCLGIIVNDPAKLDEVRELLERNNLAVPVYVAGEYDPKSTVDDLRAEKAKISIDYGEESVSKNEPELDVREEPQLEQPTAMAEPEAPITEEVVTSDDSERARTNSEAEVRAIREVINAARPDIEQLFAISRGSFSVEQATAYLLTSNQKMGDLSARYAAMLQHSQNIGELQTFAVGYEEEMTQNYGYSVNAIRVIREKALMLPISLKAPLLQGCQNVENKLAAVMSIIKSKDARVYSHDTPMDKQRTDEKELESIVKEQMAR